MRAIRDLRDDLALFAPDMAFDYRDMLELASILNDTLAQLERIESLANHANNTASCLANGIQPD